ncbi:MAG: VanZ family protein [Clostridia bacterium]
MHKRIILFSFLIVWIMIIAGLSNEVGAESKYRGLEIVKPLKMLISSNTAMNIRVNNNDNTVVFLIRKTGHMALYFVLTLLSVSLLSKTKLKRGKTVTLSFIFAIAYAGLDEYNQLHVLGRDGRVMDVLIDGFGIIVALTFSSLWTRFITKTAERV